MFGNSIAISGDSVAVGAPHEDSGGSDAGAAYVFDAPQTVGGLVVNLDGGPLAAAQPSGGRAGGWPARPATRAEAAAVGVLRLAHPRYCQISSRPRNP
ncbi:MAG: FG-GAP repeat protein [Chloroflexi bacterium]|nr:FG-GAP repeat protein [Chloroflexota bacterium]